MSRPAPLVLHAAPASGFDEPFEMLHACHERVLRMGALLGRLAAHLPAHGADAQAQQAARDLLRYFDTAGPAHHEDEERHVLPWLAANGHAPLAARLHAEHEEMTERWAAIRPVLAALAEGRAPDAGATDAWAAYAALYAAHIEAEERLAYPPVAASLPADAVQAMGREMAARRGLGA